MAFSPLGRPLSDATPEAVREDKIHELKREIEQADEQIVEQVAALKLCREQNAKMRAALAAWEALAV